MADAGIWLPAHLAGGASLHLADIVLSGLAALGLAAGVALFASGRAGRVAGDHPGEEQPPEADPHPAAALVKTRSGASGPHRRR